LAQARTAREILLLRHAKSSWEEPRRDDHARPLAPRGRDAADRMASYLQRRGVEPALILCSTAARTRETLALILAGLRRTGRVEFEQGLYLAEGEEMLRRLQEVEDSVTSVMLVGHNPGLQELALMLCGGGEAAALKAMRAKYPTGALAEIAVPAAHWRDLRPGMGRLARFTVPRELP